MSSPAEGASTVPKEEKRKSLGKLLSRAKTVLKKADPSRRFSRAGPSSAAQATPSEGLTISLPILEPQPSATQAELEAPHPDATRVPRAQLFAERAKKLGELYGLELKPSEWHQSDGNALRVEKPIRMRVHRKCHLCETSFGLGRECPKCKHPRCKSCPRIPPKRTEAEKEESRKKRAAIIKERKENAPIIPDWNPAPKKVVLTRPAKSGGQDLIHRKPRQRIRRTCCGCSKIFTSGNKTCENCEHVRCTDCPRDPAKKDKYPYGYPGDALSARIGHYQCTDCKNVYSQPPVEDESTLECRKCTCKGAHRLRPRKVEPEPDPEVWESVQARLKELALT